MTTDEALERLRPDWALSHSDGTWTVSRIDDDVDAGDVLSFLASGTNITEAIDAAEIKVEQEACEQAARHADYARRKAAGKLTPLEIANEHVAQMWSGEVFRTINTPSVLADWVNRAYEGEIVQAGTEIKIHTHNYNGVQIK